MTYPPSYHDACTHLVQFGAHGGNTAHGRAVIARALRDLRRHPRAPYAGTSRQWAQWERRNLLYITGMFPIKPQ